MKPRRPLPAPTPAAAATDPATLRVLLIDDGAHRVGLIRDELARHGHQVVGVVDSALAIHDCVVRLQPDVVIVGPSLAGVADRAGSRVAGLSAEEYIRTSIVHPSAFIVAGFQDVMQKNFGDVLSSGQINDLIAYLMTQK